DHLEEYFQFIAEQGFEKVIFDRLVDVPDDVAVSYPEFYRALRRIAELKESSGLHRLEIGNLEAYRRALSGKPDKVCTMFGSTCGAGFNNIIYMQRDVYPCGRMFGQERWKLGRFDEPLERFPERMRALVGPHGCGALAGEQGAAGPDCLIERERPDYTAEPREAFIQWFAERSKARAT
ncbi:MAG TPA: hypothetical protein VK458_33485, partial [Myxococcaceae bacterium]|nr:hypothetical protein [Myxococcaceae bacterium]